MKHYSLNTSVTRLVYSHPLLLPIARGEIQVYKSFWMPTCSAIHYIYFTGENAVLTLSLSSLYYCTLWYLLNLFCCERKVNLLWVGFNCFSKGNIKICSPKTLFHCNTWLLLIWLDCNFCICLPCLQNNCRCTLKWWLQSEVLLTEPVVLFLYHSSLVTANFTPLFSV